MKVSPVKLNALSVAKMMRALMDGPSTAADLIEVSGLSRGTVYSYTKALKTEKCIHICGWEKNSLNRDAIKIFALGRGKDAVKSRKSKALISREVRERKKRNALSVAIAGTVTPIDYATTISPIPLKKIETMAPTTTAPTFPWTAPGNSIFSTLAEFNGINARRNQKATQREESKAYNRLHTMER